MIYTKKSLDYIVEELKLLCKVAGIDIECSIAIRDRNKISGKKIDEITRCVKEKNVDLIVVEPDLPPSAILKLEKEAGREVIDRTQVILLVFEGNAGSTEAKLQIQMARLKHVLPLLRERANLAKRGEMPGFMAGGLIATEKYYRHVRRMIKYLQKKLTEQSNRRALLREQRRVIGLPLISVVGFANAGKTTFFNTATGLRKETGAIPFTTLTPKAYKVHTAGGLEAILIDTVGFVFNAPPEIIEAFKSTLEEVIESDGIILIIDSSEPREYVNLKLKEAEKILSYLNCSYKPVLLFFNKTDLINEMGALEKLCTAANNYNLNLIGCVFGTAFSKDAVNGALEAIIKEVISREGKGRAFRAF